MRLLPLHGEPCLFADYLNRALIMDKIISFLLGLYLLVAEIMAIAFFIDYCKCGDSFLQIVFIDSFLAEIKGLLWIFFI